MGSDVLIRAAGLSKAYPSRANPFTYMTGLLTGGRPGRGFKALDDVDLTVSRGEALGIVGRNGAGKSTLLQIVCGTQTPDAGRVERNGRIAAMLELGAGFDPQFTGRENARLNASIHGLSERQIEARFPAIAAFADIGDFIDRPVAEYSSGMSARLAFAICAHVDADVLVIDEVLGVGDWAFQAKCRNFIEGFLRRGAVIFVSHDEHAVVSLCGRAQWLEKGRMMADGPAEEVVRRYRDAMAGQDRPTEETANAPVAETAQTVVDDDALPVNPVEVSRFLSDAPAHGHGGAIIDDVFFSDDAGTRLDRLHGGRKVALNISGRALGEVRQPIVGFIFRDALGQNLFGDNTSLAYRDKPRHMAPGDRLHARLDFRLPLLATGTYTIAPSIIEGTQQNHIHLHWMEEALVLTVHESPVTIGLVGVPMRITAAARAEKETEGADSVRAEERLP